MIPQAYDPFFMLKIDGKVINPNLSTKITKFEFEEVDEKEDMLTVMVDNQTLEFTDDPALDIGGVLSFQFGYLHRRSAMKQARIKDLEGFTEIKVQAYQINSGVIPPPKPDITPAPAKVKSTSSVPKKYTVAKGDSLSAIAKRFGLSSWNVLYNANKSVIGKNPNLIFPGQSLIIPGKKETVTADKDQDAKSVKVSKPNDSSNPLGIKTRVWAKMTYSQIATSIAEEMGLDADVETTKTKYDHIPQTNEDNINFLRRLGKYIGFKINIYGSKLVFRHADFASRSQRTLVYYVDGAGEVEKFSPKIKTKDKSSSSSTDTTDPTNKGTESKSSSKTDTTKLGKYSYAVDGITGKETKILTPIKGASNDKVSNTNDDVTGADMEDGEQKWIEADIDCIGIPEVRAGGIITILGVGKKWSGNWYVKIVRHIIDNGGYRTTFECTRNAAGAPAKISEENTGKVNDKPGDSKKSGKVVIVDGITGKETIGEMP